MTQNKKKVPEMTFKEFLQESEINKSSLTNVNEIESDILKIFRKDGFTEAQIYSMPMEKLWPVFKKISTEKLFSLISKMEETLAKNPDMLPIIRSITKNLEKMLDDLEAELDKKNNKES